MCRGRGEEGCKTTLCICWLCTYRVCLYYNDNNVIGAVLFINFFDSEIIIIATYLHDQDWTVGSFNEISMFWPLIDNPLIYANDSLQICNCYKLEDWQVYLVHCHSISSPSLCSRVNNYKEKTIPYNNYMYTILVSVCINITLKYVHCIH